MTRQDLDQLEDVAGQLPAFERVGVFSPWRQAEGRIWPRATGLPRWRWDLNRPGRRRYDLLVACNVFMFAPDPAQWFRHTLASCRYFLLLDAIRRRRSADVEFGEEGDRVRYSAAGAATRVGPERTFALERLGDRLLGHRLFFGGANEFDDDPLHVIALVRGDLAGPVLRLDDYPTGIRPLLPDLAPLHAVIEKVEARGLPYYLGIVPALLDDAMLGFLRGLRHMVPAVHGYDHAYPRFAPALQAKGDPYNELTVGTFDEFAGRPYAAVLDRLREGRRRLEDGLGRAVTAYIPPCNRAGRRTGRALVEAGYHRYLSERRIPGCPLPHLRSDFYGRSTAYDYARTPDVVTLHVTWEWDLARRGEGAALDRLLDHLAGRAEEARALDARLAAILAEA